MYKIYCNSVNNLAIDCGFLASLTDDDQWRSTLGMYHETLLGYLQSNRFQCYLSGLYFWENFRAQTIPLLVTCVSRQAIPLFHYCSDCVNQGTCSHICCKLWLETACRNAGLQSLQPVQPYSEGTLHNIVLFGCQMVPHTELSDTDACPVSLVSGNSSSLINCAGYSDLISLTLGFDPGIESTLNLLLSYIINA